MARIEMTLETAKVGAEFIGLAFDCWSDQKQREMLVVYVYVDGKPYPDLIEDVTETSMTAAAYASHVRKRFDVAIEAKREAGDVTERELEKYHGFTCSDNASPCSGAWYLLRYAGLNPLQWLICYGCLLHILQLHLGDVFKLPKIVLVHNGAKALSRCVRGIMRWKVCVPMKLPSS